MSDHVGRRRKQSRVPVARLIVLVVALVAVGWLFTLDEPTRAPGSRDTPLAVRPRPGVAGVVGQSAVLPDGTTYEPRIYLTPDTSLGIAPTKDGAWVRVLRRVGTGKVNEVHRVSADAQPQFDGFVASGDTVVWAESLSRSDVAVDTALWRASWKSAASAARITSNTGEANFFGSQYDLVVHSGRVYWMALDSGTTTRTEVRSVPMGGGAVSIQRLTGEFALSAWPWAVSVDGGRGVTVRMVNLTTKATITVNTSVAEVATCGPQWCLMGVLSNNALARIDLQRPDGSQRRRVAGNDATPTVRDAALLDRFVPLTTDRGDGAASTGVDLMLYDLTTATTDLIATDVSSVHARAAMLWWATGSADDLTWYAVDLRTLG